MDLINSPNGIRRQDSIKRADSVKPEPCGAMRSKIGPLHGQDPRLPGFMIEALLGAGSWLWEVAVRTDGGRGGRASRLGEEHG